MIKAKSYAAFDAKSPLKPWDFERRDVGAQDLQITILYCGVCHSDIHCARGEWMNIKYPQVVGHEIVGRIVAIGDKVSDYKIGDLVGVGCLVDSCRRCPSCMEHLENYCDEGQVGTYMGLEKQTGRPTQGGYSNTIVVDKDFVLRMPQSLDPAKAAPLLCAGITLYSPLRHWGAGPGKTVGIVGLGGLGHMGVKLAHAMGAKVVLFTSSPGKVEDGKKFGANEVVLSKDKQAMKVYANQLDFIIDTVSAPHDLNPFLQLLKRDGTLVLIGAPPSDTPHAPPAVFNLLMKRIAIAGSVIGGIQETQEMLDFCADHHVLPEVEMISIKDINKAWERVLKQDVKYRFVIDMASLEEKV